MLRLSVLIRIILIRTLPINIMLIIHALGIMLRLLLRLLAVEPVLALGLGELVHLSASEPSQHLLSKLVRHRFA
jgi:hypothetical protein